MKNPYFSPQCHSVQLPSIPGIRERKESHYLWQTAGGDPPPSFESPFQCFDFFGLGTLINIRNGKVILLNNSAGPFRGKKCILALHHHTWRIKNGTRQQDLCLQITHVPVERDDDARFAIKYTKRKSQHDIKISVTTRGKIRPFSIENGVGAAELFTSDFILGRVNDHKWLPLVECSEAAAHRICGTGLWKIWKIG